MLFVNSSGPIWKRGTAAGGRPWCSPPPCDAASPAVDSAADAAKDSQANRINAKNVRRKRIIPRIYAEVMGEKTKAIPGVTRKETGTCHCVKFFTSSFLEN